LIAVGFQRGDAVDLGQPKDDEGRQDDDESPDKTTLQHGGFLGANDIDEPKHQRQNDR